MSIDYENHRKSSHRINVCYTLLCHINCKSKEKSCNSWLFREKNVTLPHERENQLDRLGQSTRRL